jgi:hypothetical protein
VQSRRKREFVLAVSNGLVVVTEAGRVVCLGGVDFVQRGWGLQGSM